MTISPWAQNFPASPASWAYSANGGVSYTSPAPVSTGQVAGPTGTQRYRQAVTIPSGAHGTWTVTVSGDIFDANVNQPAHLYYDGVDQGAVTPLAGPRTFTLPVVPGAHNVELWIGQGNAGGATAPVIAFSFAGASDTLCGCCPTGQEACVTQVSPLTCTAPVIGSTTTTFAQQHATPSSAVITANPLGYSTNNQLFRTYDASLAADLANWGVSTSGATQNTQITVRWSYNTPVNDVWGFSFWHGAGNFLNDGDGVIAADLTVYDGASVLFSGPVNSGNSGAEWTTVFPSRLSNVTHFDLANITKTGGAPNMYIREVALNFPWRATLTQNCSPVAISAAVETLASTFAPGLTLSGGVMGQTNGPHTLTWTVPAGVSGTIVTDTPADFSSLAISNGTVTTVSGNHNRTFSVTWNTAAPVTAPVYGLTCGAAVEWVDGNGNVVPDNSLVQPCDGPDVQRAAQFRMTGTFFGDGPDPLGENLCDVVPLPDATTGLNQGTAGPGCYDPTVGNPTMTWNNTHQVEFTYANPPHTSGGVFATFDSPAMGTVTWPTSGFLDPGNTWTSNVAVNGRRLLATVISAPTGSNRPHFTGTQLRMHLASTDSVTPGTRMRIEVI